MRSIVLIGMFFCALCSYAQVVRDSVQVYFRQGQSVVDASYRDNADRFKLLQERYLLYSRCPQYWLKGIRIVSSASPEATFSYNALLSQRRAEAVLYYLNSHSVIDASLLQVQPLGEDWANLRCLVEQDAEMPFRREVLESLDRYPDGQEGEWDLKRIAGGEAYRYLHDHVFPLLRRTYVVFDVKEEPKTEYPAVTSFRRPMPSMPLSAVRVNQNVPISVSEVESKDTLTWAVKSNLLYDALTALNVEVEVPIKNHWSVMVEHVFPWWERDNKYCLQLLETGVEGRYWFRNNRWHSQKLQGHFVGVYAMSGKYDLQWDKDLCYQGKGWSAGLTYGYSMPLAKWCHLEFALSVGYLRTRYQHYQPSPDYEHLYRDPGKAGNLSVIGPTKLKVSLVVPINLIWRAER